jgi:molybdopterin/thiamine biosynthesis adenylyltransferase
VTVGHDGGDPQTPGPVGHDGGDPQTPGPAGVVVLVGAGGIGAPAALALAASGVRALRVADDDRVELSNLHRQILFTDADVGRPKLDAFAEALRGRWPGLEIELHRGRALPHTVAGLVAGAAVVVDATDNFASRFLLADACALAGVPVVHAAAVRWSATVMAVSAHGRPCYRCLFEDVPQGDAPDCASAGVAGPVCGVAGALAADRALRVLAGDDGAYGSIVTFDGRSDRLRSVAVRARRACALCGEAPTLRDLDPGRYVSRACEADF